MDKIKMKLTEKENKCLHSFFVEILYGLDIEKYLRYMGTTMKEIENIKLKVNQGSDLNEVEIKNLVYFISVMIAELDTELQTRTGYELIDYINLQYKIMNKHYNA